MLMCVPTPYDINTSEQISEKGKLIVSRNNQTNEIKQWVNAVFYWYHVRGIEKHIKHM